MATNNIALSSTIDSIIAETGLTVKDIKTVFIKDGGVCYFPTKDENGNLHLSHKSFTHAKVAEARANKKALKAQAKAEAAAAKAQSLSQPTITGESTVTVISSSAVQSDLDQGQSHRK